MINRRKKRPRSKPSPQTLSTPKKYRQSVKSANIANIDTDTEITDSAVSGVSVSQEVPLSGIPDLPETESESESGDSLIMAHMDLQATQSSIGEPNGSFDMQSKEGVSIQFSEDPDFIPDQSQGARVHQAPPNMNFHPANMANISHQMHMFQQMQPMQTFRHPIMNPSLHMSEDDIVRYATKMNELLADRIETLVKTQVEAVIVPMREKLNKSQSDLAKVQKELKKVIVKNDDLEQYSRRTCLIIAGIKENDTEDVTQKSYGVSPKYCSPHFYT